MKILVSVAALVACIAGSAAAQPAANFETALRRARVTIHHARQRQIRARVQTIAERIKRASRDTRDIASDANRIYFQLQNIRRRAAWRRFPPPNSPRDPSFNSDVQMLLFNMRQLALNTAQLEQIVADIEREAPADPALKEAAQNLLADCVRLHSLSNYVLNEAHYTRSELSWIGYHWAGMRLVQDSAYIQQAAEGALAKATALKNKVSPGILR
ncbi:MAG: hypothetical protein HY551_07545 [Elusimicrobia bacterium]|nr:hypothetical protein [Elusimicrobiota bacterium]